MSGAGESRRSSTKRAFFLGSAVALTALLLILVARRQGAGWLLDGTRVVLQEVTYGTNHVMPKAPFERLFRLLPVNWSEAIHWRPSSGMGSTTAQPIFTFWLNCSSPAAASQSIGYAIADENGFEGPMTFTGRYGTYAPGGFSKSRIGLIRGAGTFPRRSKTFFLRLYQESQDGQRVRVAEFPVRNLAFQDYPHWKPQDLPIERETNGFTFSFITVKVGIAPPGPLVPPYGLQAGDWSEFRFRVSAQGKPLSGWSINEMIIADASGNRLRVSAEDLGAFNRQFSRVEHEEIVCFHRWMYWADEPAWRISVHFEQPGDWGCWMEYLVRPEFLRAGLSAHPQP
jgi:hypothetical protein